MIKKNLRFTLMKRSTFIFFLLLLVVTAMISCSKGGTLTSDEGGGVHNPSGADTTAPVLNIFTPVATDIFSNGSTINVTGKITDENGLYRGSITITNDANGMVIKNQPYEIHGILTYNFNVNHIVSTAVGADYTVTVSFEDHGYNVTTKSVKVKANP
jgi:preprotein translocase subunit SecG